MHTNIKSTGLELTSQIKDYINKRVSGLDKFIHYKDESVQAWVEVGRTTRHHQTGDVFRAEIQIRVPHNEKGARAEAVNEDLYAAIDDAHDQMKLELEKIKDKKVSLARKGGRLFKKLFFKKNV